MPNRGRTLDPEPQDHPTIGAPVSVERVLVVILLVLLVVWLASRVL